MTFDRFVFLEKIQEMLELQSIPSTVAALAASAASAVHSAPAEPAALAASAASAAPKFVPEIVTRKALISFLYNLPHLRSSHARAPKSPILLEERLAIELILGYADTLVWNLKWFQQHGNQEGYHAQMAYKYKLLSEILERTGSICEEVWRDFNYIPFFSPKERRSWQLKIAEGKEVKKWKDVKQEFFIHLRLDNMSEIKIRYPSLFKLVQCLDEVSKQYADVKQRLDKQKKHEEAADVMHMKQVDPFIANDEELIKWMEHILGRRRGTSLDQKEVVQMLLKAASDEFPTNDATEMRKMENFFRAALLLFQFPNDSDVRNKISNERGNMLSD